MDLTASFDWSRLLLPHGLAVAVALVLDRFAIELPTRWHPVAWMGRYLGAMGGLIAPRSREPSPNWTAFAAGALAWYGGAMAIVLLAWSLQWWLVRQDPVLAGVVLGLGLKTMLSWRRPRDDVAGVEVALAHSLDAGRRQLGRLVSREVMQLDADGVRASAIESLAGNLNASMVAPVFWFVVAGLPGAVLYRFAHTADAMWGFRGWRAGAHWEWAGKWAARADDVLSWLPARMSALLLAVGVGGLPLGQLWREAGRTVSPNSGWPLAAMAMALGTRLRQPGAVAFNGAGRTPAAADTARAIRLGGRAVWLLAGWSLLMLAALRWGRP